MNQTSDRDRYATRTGEKRASIIEFLLPLAFLTVTVGIYIPSSLFLKNIDEFSVGFTQILPWITLPCAVTLAVGLAIALLVRGNRRIASLVIDIIFGVSLGTYVQSNWLNGMLKQLNGTEMVWDNASLPALLSIAAWGVCLATPHVIRFVSNRMETLISKYGSAMLSAMQLISLVVLMLTTTRTVGNDFALTKKDEFVLADGNNEVVFVVDTLDAQWAEQYVLNEPEYVEALKDFTYFDNVVSCGAPTILGMRMMFTGQAYDPSIPLSEYLAHVYDNSTLFSDLKANGYDVRLYTLQTYLTNADIDSIDNAATNRHYAIAAPAKFIRDLYTLTAYNVAPYPLKKHFMLYSAELTNNAKVEDSEADNVLLEDPEFYRDFLEKGLSVREGRNAFVLYHLFGAHGPYSMDENAQRVDEDQTSLPQQIHGSMKIILDYMAQMKRLGIYDDSMIIITADHGGVSLYQNPAVFVKRRGTKDALDTNSAPLTFANLRASFVEDIVADYAETYGPGMFDVAEDDKVGLRPHTFDSILYTNIHPDEPAIRGSYMRFMIGNPARDDGRIVDVSVVNEYVFGTRVEMCGESADPNMIVRGFTGIENTYRWTNGAVASIPLHISEPITSLLLTMDCEVFNGSQHVVLYANDDLVFDGQLTSGTLGPLTIMGECVGDDGNLELRFELPDAVSPQELGINTDDRKLGVSLKAFEIDAAN